MRVLLAAVLFSVSLLATTAASAQVNVPSPAPALPPLPQMPLLGEKEVEMPKVDMSAIDYSHNPDPQTTLALAPFRERKANFHYMGRTAGLDGWFMTMPDNFVQIAYTSPEGDRLVIGFVVGPEGRNLTEQQLINLRERDPEVNRLFTDRVEDAKARLSRDRGFQELMTNLNMNKPGDKLYAEMTQAPSLQIGKDDAPLLLMVMDPQCPFCKQAWKKLEKDYVSKDKLLVRMIPVAIMGQDSMRMAEVLLGADGRKQWDAYTASDYDPSKLAGVGSEEGKRRYAVNAALYNRWKLKGTPFFAYRSKSGGIKVLNELPKDWDELVKDIAPAQSVTLPQ